MTDLDTGTLTRTVARATLGAALLLVAGCGGPDGSYGSGDTSASAGGNASIETRKGGLGTYLTDEAGRTVYMFASDTAGTSTCTGPCAEAWPPLTTDDVAAASGGARSDRLTTIKRSDGQMQVAYGGHPLYYFAKDAKAGDVEGQGSNGFDAKWWVLAPSGEPITKAEADAPAQTGGGGY